MRSGSCISVFAWVNVLARRTLSIKLSWPRFVRMPRPQPSTGCCQSSMHRRRTWSVEGATVPVVVPGALMRPHQRAGDHDRHCCALDGPGPPPVHRGLAATGRGLWPGHPHKPRPRQLYGERPPCQDVDPSEDADAAPRPHLRSKRVATGQGTPTMTTEPDDESSDSSGDLT